MVLRHKEITGIVVIILSILLFFTVFIPYFYLPYKIFLSKTKYINELIFGFGGPASIYLFFYFVSKKNRWFNNLFPKYNLWIKFVSVILVTFFEAEYQFFWNYNPDSVLQFAFFILGLPGYCMFIWWFWRE